jgi:hypothetical protein
MKKTCSMCYHCTKQAKCNLTGQRVNTTKQRDKCKSWRTSPPRDRSMDGGYGYGADFMDIATMLALLGKGK